MKKLHLIFMALCLIFITGCGSDDDASSEAKIIGKWDLYLEVEKYSDDNEFEHKMPSGWHIMKFKPDGTVINTFPTRRAVVSIDAYHSSF